MLVKGGIGGYFTKEIKLGLAKPPNLGELS